MSQDRRCCRILAVNRQDSAQDGLHLVFGVRAHFLLQHPSTPVEDSRVREYSCSISEPAGEFANGVPTRPQGIAHRDRSTKFLHGFRPFGREAEYLDAPVGPPLLDSLK